MSVQAESGPPLATSAAEPQPLDLRARAARRERALRIVLPAPLRPDLASALHRSLLAG